MNKQKGFTIIELIVVIAIIAVLASIVLVNVTQYIGKAKDTAVKANIDTIIMNATAMLADPTSSLSGFLGTYDYTAAAAQISASNGSVDAVATCDAMDAGDCTAAATLICVSSPLVSAGGIYCKDSSGNVGTIVCAAGVCQ